MPLPPTMRAARVRRFGDPLTIEVVPTPQPGPGEIVVAVRACGVCHTDLHACRGDWRAKPSLPLIPGHEIVGDVAALGLDVTNVGIGDRVGVFWLNRTCGTCEYCTDEWESLCPRQVNTGFGVSGGFAEYVCVAADYAVPAPTTIEPTLAAPLLCAGVSAYKAVREAGLRPGETLAIVGCGGVGHLAIAYARAAGLRVVAIDVSDMALSLARSLGADETVDGRDTETLRRLKKAGVHGSLVAAANADAIRVGVDLLRRKGIAILVGLPAGDASFPVFDVVVKRFTIRGSIGGTRADVAAALDIAVHAGIRPHVDVRRLEEINDVFARMDKGELVGRTVLRIAE